MQLHRRVFASSPETLNNEKTWHESKEDLPTSSHIFSETLKSAAYAALPTRSRTPNNLWISCWTLGLLEQRDVARRSADYDEEKKPDKLIKQSAREDRKKYLDVLFQNGDWHELKKVRK